MPKILDFGYFVLTDKKQEILKQSCKDLFEQNCQLFD